MGSTSKQVKAVKRLASVALNGGPSLSSAADQENVLQPRKKHMSDSVRPNGGATAESCSLGHEASDASDCESESRCEEPADLLPEDQILKGSKALSMEEVIERRLRMTKLLSKIYKAHYWCLVEEAKAKYRRFYIRNGKSGWREDAEEDQAGEQLDDTRDRMREPEKGSLEQSHCGAQGCTSKPMALSVFCFSHILMEPRQRLYKPCSYVARKVGQNGSSSSPPACGKPVLRSMMPAYCTSHLLVAKRQANRSLNKVLPGGAKVNPKLHLIISQYVRVIQSNRRSREPLASSSPNGG